MGAEWLMMVFTCLEEVSRQLAGVLGSLQGFLRRLAQMCSHCGLRVPVAAKREQAPMR